MAAGNAWECLLHSMIQNVQGFDGDKNYVLNMALPLVQKGGPLVQGMNMVAEALSGVKVAPADPSGSFRRLLSMVVYAPSRMAMFRTVPDDPAHVATMVALAGIAESIPGSSAQNANARCMSRTGPVSAWGYDGPLLSAGFIRSLIVDTWIPDLQTPESLPKGWAARSKPEPPAFPVELVASITGGQAPKRDDILRAKSLEYASDLPYHNGTDDVPPGSPLPMDADMLDETSRLRRRMGDAWPMMGILRGQSWNHPFIPSMADMRFIIYDMDWSIPPAEGGPEQVISSFLDVMDDGTGGVGSGYGWFSGHALASWSASLHDPLMMAATPAAAAHADRMRIIFAQVLNGLISREGSYDSITSDASTLDPNLIRDLAPFHDMPDEFVKETMASRLYERMQK